MFLLRGGWRLLLSRKDDEEPFLGHLDWTPSMRLTSTPGLLSDHGQSVRGCLAGMFRRRVSGREPWYRWVVLQGRGGLFRREPRPDRILTARDPDA